MDFDGWGDLFFVPFVLALVPSLILTGYAVRKFFAPGRGCGSMLIGLLAFVVLYLPVLIGIMTFIAVVLGFLRKGLAFFR